MASASARCSATGAGDGRRRDAASIPSSRRADATVAVVVGVAAALEIFHAAALVHDDIIDNSDTRRGAPSAHRRFERLHRESGWAGDAADFGRRRRDPARRPPARLERRTPRRGPADAPRPRRRPARPAPSSTGCAPRSRSASTSTSSRSAPGVAQPDGEQLPARRARHRLQVGEVQRARRRS